VSKAIEGAQKRVEGRNFEIRKHLLEYDDVMNSQREFVYVRRNEIMEKEAITEQIDGYISDIAQATAESFSYERKYMADWDHEGLELYLRTHFGISFSYSDEYAKYTVDEFTALISPLIANAYRSKAAVIGDDNLKHLERMVALRVIDTKWREHLLQMDELRDGIWTVGYGERNPLVEYKLKGFAIFHDMMLAMKQDIVEMLCKVQVQAEAVFDDRPAQYRPVGRAQHAEVGQFAQAPVAGAPNYAQAAEQLGQRRHDTVHAPVEGGVKRKKTRRDRR
jgi:preprotein translocase subunit SecA